uniref:Galectin n=1 Tax=Littorina littorea TaxID=31216 RepID=A0A0A7RVW9_LITLI|nr:galectin-2-1 [Littorina littorea]
MTTISPVVVPYTGAIPGGVHQGLEIEIQGTVPHYAHQGFGVNLCQGPQKEPTTTLHFNPRLNEHCVVLNHMQNGGWGGEERKPGQHFHKGKPFDLRIMVKPQMFKIKVNGQLVADFAHRLPKETAQFIVIEGEVSINYIKFSAGGHGGGRGHGAGFAPQPSGYMPQPSGYMPQPSGYALPFSQPSAPAFGQPYPMGAHAAPPQPAVGGQPIYNPPVPFTSGIPGGLAPGRMISISGVPHANPSRFSVNLQSGTYDGSDVALQFDVRFRFGDSVNTVVRNHCQAGGWGQEERGASYFPFMPNANFDMLILVEPQAFKVAVNNQHFAEFRHRLPVHAANTLNVSGDVRLTQVRFQ